MIDQIMKSIKVAKANLGDLLLTETLIRVTGQTYAGGVYTPITANVPVELVIDRFTVEERQAEGFNESDLKVSVFNNDTQDLEITVNDQITVNGTTYNVRTCNPAYVGTVKALFELMLRK